LQEIDVVGGVHARGRCRAVCPAIDDLVAGVCCGGEQARGTLRLFGAPLLHAAHDEGLRIVLGVLVGVDDLHGVAMALASRSAAISASLKPTSRMISTVCSPTAGDFRRVSIGASESLMGLPADFTGPMPG
jgi:hypothetical protein